MTIRVVTTLFGRDKYSFESPPEHYRTRTTLSEQEVAEHVSAIDHHFKDGNILYYFITEDIIDVEKGIRLESKVYHKAGQPKHRTVLNEKARQTSSAGKRVSLTAFFDGVQYQIAPQMPEQVGINWAQAVDVPVTQNNT